MKDTKVLEAALLSCHGNESEVARALNVSPGNVNDWRKGTRDIPFKRRLQLAELAGLDPLEHAKEIAAKLLGKALHSFACGAVAMLSYGATDHAQSAVVKDGNNHAYV